MNRFLCRLLGHAYITTGLPAWNDVGCWHQVSRCRRCPRTRLILR